MAGLGDVLDMARNVRQISGGSLEMIGNIQEADRRRELERLKLEEQAMDRDRAHRLQEQQVQDLMTHRQINREQTAFAQSLELQKAKRDELTLGLGRQIESLSDEINRLDESKLFDAVSGRDTTATDQRIKSLQEKLYTLNDEAYRTRAGLPLNVPSPGPRTSIVPSPVRENNELGLKAFKPLSKDDITISQFGMLPSYGDDGYVSYGDYKFKSFTEARPMRVTMFGNHGDPHEPSEDGVHQTFTGAKANSKKEAYAAVNYAALEELGFPAGASQAQKNSLIKDYRAVIYQDGQDPIILPVKDIGPVRGDTLDLSERALQEIGRSATGPNSISDDSPVTIQYVHVDSLPKGPDGSLFPDPIDPNQVQSEPMVEPEAELAADVDFFGPSDAVSFTPEGEQPPSSTSPTYDQTLVEVGRVNQPNNRLTEPTQPKPITGEEIRSFYTLINSKFLGSTNGQAKANNLIGVLADRVAREQPSVFDNELREIALSAVQSGAGQEELLKSVPDYMLAMGGQQRVLTMYQEEGAVALKNRALEQSRNKIAQSIDSVKQQLTKAKVDALNSREDRPAEAAIWDEEVKELTAKLSDLVAQQKAIGPDVVSFSTAVEGAQATARDMRGTRLATEGLVDTSATDPKLEAAKADATNDEAPDATPEAFISRLSSELGLSNPDTLRGVPLDMLSETKRSNSLFGGIRNKIVTAGEDSEIIRAVGQSVFKDNVEKWNKSSDGIKQTFASNVDIKPYQFDSMMSIYHAIGMNLHKGSGKSVEADRVAARDYINSHPEVMFSLWQMLQNNSFDKATNMIHQERIIRKNREQKAAAESIQLVFPSDLSD